MPSTLNKFGVPIDGQKAGLLMPKRQHLFRVLFTNFGPTSGQQSLDLSRQVNTMDKPKISMQPIAVDSYNSKAYYPGKHEWQEVTCVVRDDITNAVSTLVGHQLQKQLNHYEQTAPAAGSNFKFGTKVEVLDGGNDNVLESWELEGCFLSNVDYNNLDYTAAEAQTINMTIRYDNATINDGIFPNPVTGLFSDLKTV